MRENSLVGIQHEELERLLQWAAAPCVTWRDHQLSGISMDAERAGRRIVLATKRGEPELILTGAANALAHFHEYPGPRVPTR